ncbi:MAG: DUF2318 domain-containing protein, partial [Dehalococcoidia bacterium]|nr:DUF2318 domain-containing protein [Dehalococcoidia bacterium]
PAGSGKSGAERRKQAAALRVERTWRLALVSSALLVSALMVSAVFAGSNTIDPTPEPLAASEGAVTVSMDQIPDGQLRKFSARVDGADIRFLAARGKDGDIYTAFDACEICGAKGYMQEGENAICKNCNAPIPWDTLGHGGGCNPIRLEAGASGTQIVVHLEHLKAELERFR